MHNKKLIGAAIAGALAMCAMPAMGAVIESKEVAGAFAKQLAVR